ncbi:hypothetical protein IB276_32895 [Ensifer sp. ENS04]|uniref:phage tail protein n=1 Tax=Ensifer sp. ENS04 TaxID=2769281 RepID=UPI0017870AAB|nr:phage tail protein [Ensifer sp. ENS04]MBD9544244.1 hypothetical protein [Ensifer sp. ENS04]
MTIHDISLRKLSGSKGDKSKITNTSDNLFSTDVVEALLGISEGPIKGLKDGAKTYLIGETALLDTSGSSNFENFELINYKGSEIGEDIYSRLGGFGASTTVSTQLATDVPVIRTGTHTQIDYLDVRFAINQLIKSNQKGTFNHTGRWTIEYKAVSDSLWTPVRTPEKNPLPPQISGDSFDIFYGDEGTEANINASPGDRPTFWASSQPISTANAGIWFNTSNNFQPKVFNGTTWSFPANLVFANNHWTWSEASSWGEDKSTKAFVGTKLPKDVVYEQGDYWLRTDINQAFFYNGSSWIIAGSSLRPGSFGENGTGGSIEIKDGEILLTGKTQQVFPKEFRIPVPRIDEPYMLRVVKTSPANTTELFFDITWESFQEVTAKGYKFPALATTQLVARASEQFSSIPDFSGIYEGRIIRVPSNYNPVTRVYTGVWDGTWKLAYSNNPAYVGYDLVMNDRYGMNAYYPITLSKWDVYDAGVWCDTLTADGRPRFTYNGLIADPRGGRDALNYVCGIFAGRFFDDGNGTGVIKVDKDSGASVVFSPENVVDGLFTYSFTEISTRHNDITVAFTNPELQWQEDRRRVFDQDHIDQYGRIPHNFIAVGCTSAEEAIVRARYHLITGIKETMMVNFKTNRMGLYLSPYDVVLLSDPDMEFGVSGRVQSVAGPRTIQLREPIFLEPGFSHRISFQVISEATDDFVIESRDLTSATGSLTQLITTADLPALPADAVFTIEQTNGEAAPVAFRVMSINEIDGDPDNVEIQAMQMHRAKWLFIDGHLDTIADVDKYILDSKKKPQPVRNVRVRAKKRRVGSRYAVTITLDWEKSLTKTVSRYKIEGSRDNGPMSTLAETPGLQFEWDDIPPGEYLFQVTAIDVNGYASKAEVIEHRLIGDHLVVDDVTALRMVDEPSATVFERRSPTFQWGRSTNPNHEEYVVQIRTTAGGAIREQVVEDTAYTYEYALNVADNGGNNPRRSFMIRVASKDQYGFLSDFEELTVSNPSPAAPATQSVSLRRGTAVVKYDPPAARDFVGVLIHGSTEQGFTPDSSNLKYKGPNTDVALDLEEGSTNYIRVGFYDVFGDTGLNYGAEMSIDVPTVVDGDTIPPGKPTGLTITPGIGFLIAEWVNPSDDDLEQIEFFYNTVDDSTTAKFGAASNGDSVIIPGLKFGQLYYVWARAVDFSGNRSDFTTPVTGTPFRIDSDAIQDAVINADKLAANAVTQGKIAANAVTNEKLADLTISAAKLQDLIIDTSKIVANAVTAAQLAANAVTTTQLADLAVNAQKVADNAINSNKIAANAVTSEELAALAVLEGNLADAAVSSNKIVANAVTAAKISANAVIARHITAQSISASKLAIANLSNDFPDFDMMDDAFYSSGTSYSITGTGIAYNGARQISIPFGAAQQEVLSSLFAVTQSSDYWFEGVLRGDPGLVSVNLYSTNADGTATYTRNVVLISGNVAGKQSSSFTTAANETRAKLIFRRNAGGTVDTYFSAPVVRRKASAELIVDGAITSAKVAADAITATHIAANAVTAEQILAASITGAKIAANTITAANIAANTITAAEIAANTITAAKIAANTITGAQIAADAITAKHMILVDGTNLIQNGSFTEITKDTMDALWTFNGGAYVQSNSATQSVACFRYASGTSWVQTGQASVVIDRLTAAGPAMYMTTKSQIPVTAGEVLTWETELRSDVAADAGFYYRIMWYDANGTALTSPAYTDAQSNQPVTTTFTIKTGQVTVPAAACFCNVRIYHNNTDTTARYFVIDRLVLRRANAASLIVDGTITGAKIAANTITAGQIAANAITGNELAANSVAAAAIVANAITAAKIAANAVTAVQLAANAVLAVNIAADAVTADKINVTSLSAVNANAGTVTAGVLRSSDSKMQVDLTNKRILIAD